MAHTCLLTVIIENEKEIAVHPNATHYSIRGQKLRFFRVNPSPENGMNEIPRNVNVMRFPDYRKYMYWINYGSPEFYGYGIRRQYFKNN